MPVRSRFPPSSPLSPWGGCCFASCGAGKVVIQSRREPALFLVLIIGIVDREKTSLGAVQDLAIFAAESRAPGVVQVISVCDPTHDIEPPAGRERLDVISL